MAMLSVVILFMALAVCPKSAEAMSVTIDSVLDNTFRAMKWKACTSPTSCSTTLVPNVTFAHAFVLLLTQPKLPLGSFLQDPYAPTVPAAYSISSNKDICLQQFITAFNSTTTTMARNCTNLAQFLLLSSLCLMSYGLSYPDLTPFLSQINCSYVIANINYAGSCFDGLQGCLLFQEVAQQLSSSNPAAIQVLPTCSSGSLVLMSATFPGNLIVGQDVPGTCNNGLDLDCTRCVPYFQNDAVAQPYAFLIYCALKGSMVEIIQIILVYISLKRRLPRKRDIKAMEFKRTRSTDDLRARRHSSQVGTSLKSHSPNEPFSVEEKHKSNPLHNAEPTTSNPHSPHAQESKGEHVGENSAVAAPPPPPHTDEAPPAPLPPPPPVEMTTVQVVEEDDGELNLRLTLGDVLIKDRKKEEEEVAFTKRVKSLLFQSILVGQFYMCAFTAAYTIIFFGICANEGRAHLTSKWDIYQAIYFRFMNSACPTVPFTNLLFLASLPSGYPLESLVYMMQVVAIVLIFPCIVTHCIPGVVMYFWVIIIVMSGLAIMVVFNATLMASIPLTSLNRNHRRVNPYQIPRNCMEMALLMSKFLKSQKLHDERAMDLIGIEFSALVDTTVSYILSHAYVQQVERIALPFEERKLMDLIDAETEAGRVFDEQSDTVGACDRKIRECRKRLANSTFVRENKRLAGKIERLRKRLADLSQDLFKAKSKLNACTAKRREVYQALHQLLQDNAEIRHTVFDISASEALERVVLNADDPAFRALRDDWIAFSKRHAIGDSIERSMNSILSETLYILKHLLKDNIAMEELTPFEEQSLDNYKADEGNRSAQRRTLEVEMLQIWTEHFISAMMVKAWYTMTLTVALTAMLTCALQSSYNWSALIYGSTPTSGVVGGTTYIEALQAEYESRRWECYLEVSFSSVSNGFQFLSSFLV